MGLNFDDIDIGLLLRYWQIFCHYQMIFSFAVRPDTMMSAVPNNFWVLCSLLGTLSF